MARWRSIYSTWGFHDEMGDRVALTEEMARQALQSVMQWQSRGYDMEAFMLDGFWFDELAGFSMANRLHWSTPMDAFLGEVRAAGFVPGLWFPLNGGWLRVPAWQESLSADGWHYSLLHGPFADALEAALFQAAEQWGVRFFKCDFGGLAADVSGSLRSSREAYRLGFERLRTLFQHLRARFPDITLIGHAGLTRDLEHERGGGSALPIFDLSLLELFDYVATPDPQFGDHPATAATRAFDLLADRGTWQWQAAGVPLARIYDQGKLLGPTRIAAKRDLQGLARSHLAHLARGSGLDIYAGDPTLPDPSDLRFLRRARQIFADAHQRRLETRFVGPAAPTDGAWHGWLTGGGRSGLLMLTNSSLQTVWAELELTDLDEATVLFHDGSLAPVLQLGEDHLRLELGPEQVALVGLGESAAIPPFAPQILPALLRDARLLPANFRRGPLGLEAQLAHGVPPGYELLVIARAWDAPPDGARRNRPFRFGAQSARGEYDPRPRSHQVLTISVESQGQRVNPKEEIPEGPTWADLSWVARRFSLPSAATIRVSWNLEPPVKLTVEAYAVRV